MGAETWYAIGTFIKAIFIGTEVGGAYAFAVNVARLALLSIAAKQFIPKPDLSRAARDKLLTVRDTIAPQTFIYGEDMVSGPIMWTQLSSSINFGDYDELHVTVALAGHECDSIVKYRLDEIDVPLSDIQFGIEAGPVMTGTFADVAIVNRLLGTQTQTCMSLLYTDFPSQWGVTTHTFRGWTVMSWKFTLVKDNTDMFDAGAPQNLRALVRGRKIYDPRRDTTNGGTGAHRLADPTTWEWSDNPALCLADFIHDEKFGMRDRTDRIDWPLVITAANICDEFVGMPGPGIQRRYTCNATFQATELRRDVRDALLGSMMGRLVFSQGLWRMWAGAALAATVTLTEANLAGQIQLQASAGAKERYNRVRGKYIDRERGYLANPYPEQRSAAYEAADGGEVNEKVLDFLHTNNSYEAQRKAIIALKQSRSQRVVVFQGNYSCFRIQPGTTVLLDIAEYGFVNEKFFVTEWTLTETGIALTMVQEDDSVWTNPLISDYTVRSFSGVLVAQSTGAMAPSVLSATPGYGGVLLQWTNPVAAAYSGIEVWASDTNDRNAANLIGTVTNEQFFDQVSTVRQRWYWVRSVDNYGRFSSWLPNLGTSAFTATPLSDGMAASIPSFTPGTIGGLSDLLISLNAVVGGTPNDGEIRIQGTTLITAAGTVRTLAASDIELFTPYEGAVVGRFYLMYSNVVAETRFGGVTGDWGGGDTRFCVVTHDITNGWRARDNGGVYYAFTPLATDNIFAVCDKSAATGGIEAINIFLGGIVGADGAAGGDGLSVVHASVYRRSATAPATPTADDGEYNFTTNVLTPPALWSVTPPAGTDPLYISQGSFDVVGPTGIDSTVIWTTPAILVQDGAQGIPGTGGVDGLSVHVANIYQRSASAPGTPAVDDGSYNFSTNTLTPAVGWLAAPPAGADPLYVSVGTFEIQGTTGTDSTVVWSAPAVLVQDGATGGTGSPGTPGADGLSVFIAQVFKRSATAPATPTLNDGSYNFGTSTLTPPATWSVTVPAGTDPLYVSQGAFEIQGPTGIDSTVAWTAPNILASDGADGGTGPAGSDGNSVHVAQIYLRKGTVPGTPAVNDGAYNFGTNALTPPSTGGGSADNWFTTVPAGVSPLYVCSGTFEVNGTTGIDSTVTWSAPVVLASDGADGGTGPAGSDGVSVHVANIYKRAATQPATPAVNDGSYNFTTNALTPAATWSASPPGGTDPLWVASGSFSVVGQTGTDSTVVWTVPTNLVSDGADGGTGPAGGDGTSTYVASVYRRSATAPATPTLNDGAYNFGTQVLTPPALWSTSPPAGSDALYVSVGSFSVVGATGIDSTVTWTAPVIFVESGLIRDILFRRQASMPATPTGDNPAGWFNEVPGGTAALWQTTGTKNFAGTLQGTWSTPEVVTGMQYRGAYSGIVAYILHDVVTYQERGYICVAAGTGNAPSGTNSGNAWWDLLSGKGDPGDPATAFNETIAVTGTGSVNLRTLADNHTPAYDGIGDATIIFQVGAGVTLTALAGADAIDSGSWPIAATIDLKLEVSGTVIGGGGSGGAGGAGFGTQNGGGGGSGGDAISLQENFTSGIVVNSGGILRGGGGGGGGGAGATNDVMGEPIDYGGGGGGGGYPNGGGGNGGSGFGGTAGSPGTTGGGGAGGTATTGGDGGNGGGIAANGVAGGSGSGNTTNGTPGALGPAGYAVRKNGKTATVSGPGTISGTVA